MKAKKHIQPETYRGMMATIINMIVRPSIEWSRIEKEKLSTNDTLTFFPLPLMGFTALITFLRTVITASEGSLIIALKRAAILFIAYISTLYLTQFALQKSPFTPESVRHDEDKIFRLLAYSSTVVYLAGMVAALFPDSSISSFIGLLGLLSIFQVKNYTDAAQNGQLALTWQFSFFVAMLLAITPMLIIHLLSPLI
jgi:hypothetical protein